MKNLQTLAEKINNFNSFYEMSDCHNRYMDGESKNAEIKEELKNLSNRELIELRSLITKSEDIVNRYWGEYFENLEPEPTTENPKSIIFKNAWYYFKKGIYVSFGECLRAAWKAYKAVKSLSSGIVSLTYRKATGEIRNATGTLNMSFYTPSKKGVRRESKPDTIKYFDLEKQAWRMFRIERLINLAA